MNDNVRNFPVPKVADQIVRQAASAGITDAVLLGYDADGRFVMATSAPCKDVLWLIENAKRWLL